MNSSGRTLWLGVLPLLLIVSSCTDPVVNLERPELVDSCDRLIPVGIELVNDYVYTLLETDLGETGGDPESLPGSLVALNARGRELDARADELECDLEVLNRSIADATAGIEIDDPVVQALLETVRGGVTASLHPAYGSWVLETGVASIPDHPITLILDDEAASGYAGCNGYYYPAVLSDGLWAWDDGAATVTEVLCGDDAGNPLTEVMAAEATFLQAFESVTGYTLAGDTLVLTGETIELRFVRTDESSAG